jgi:hypothetical protein
MTVHASPTEAPKAMSPRSWLFSTFAIVVAIVGINLFIAWRFDVFGILRDPRGRYLANSRHERKAKYLLNFKYVPENFDALVIGASSSANWRLEGLSAYHFYNESILGGDGTEERMLVEKALETGHFKVALVGISRGVTDRHDLQDGLDQVDPHEALGSVYAYAIMFDRFHDYVIHRPSSFYSDGSWEFPQHKLEPRDPNNPYTAAVIDKKALDDYRAMIRELIDHHVRIVYVVAPHYGLEVGGAGPILAQYVQDFLAQVPPAPLIDFNDDQYAQLRANPDLMIDEDHLSLAGVPIYSKIVIERMHQALQDR